MWRLATYTRYSAGGHAAIMLMVRLVNCLAVLAITIAACPIGSSHRHPQQLEDLEERGRTAFRQGHYGKALDTLEVARRLEARGKPWKQ